MSDGFTLKGFSNELFSPTEPIPNSIMCLSTDNLVHYKKHPFRLYKGKKLDDLVESIKLNGVLIPLIIRKLENNTYEILSGHNRFEASKITGLAEVPCLIKEGLTDDEAHIIVIESNLYQRSFSELAESEKAEVIYSYYQAIKRQGKRNDLIESIESHDEKEVDEPKLSSEIVGEQVGLSKTTISRYLKAYILLLKCRDFEEMIDKKSLAIRSACYLSFLSQNELQILYQYIENNGKIKIDILKAEELKKLSEEHPLNHDSIEKVFKSNFKEEKQLKPKAVKVNAEKIKSYFNEEDSAEKIEETIYLALAYYFENQKNEEKSEV